MTLGTLAADVEAYRAAVGNHVVSYVMAPEVDVEGGFQEQRCRLSRSGPAIRIERESKLLSGGETINTVPIVHGYDGAVATQWNPREQIVWRTSDIEPLRELRLQCSGYADLLGWYGPGEGDGGLCEVDLLNILKSSSSSLRSGTELVSGRECHVVDYAPANAVGHIIWLDTQLAGVPMKQVMTRGGGSVLLTRTIDEFVELAGGVVLPVAGTIQIAPIGGDPVLGNGRIDHVVVLPMPEHPDVPDIHVGVDFPAGYFQCADLITPGSWIADDAGKVVIASAAGGWRGAMMAAVLSIGACAAAFLAERRLPSRRATPA